MFIQLDERAVGRVASTDLPWSNEAPFFHVETDSTGALSIHRYEFTSDGTDIEMASVYVWAAGVWKSFHMDAPSPLVQEIVRRRRERADIGTGQHL